MEEKKKAVSETDIKWCLRYRGQSFEVWAMSDDDYYSL